MNRFYYQVVAALFLAGLSPLAVSLASAAEDPSVIVSAPVAPIVLNIDLRDLPQVTPWQPGDPVKIIPEAANSEVGVAGDPLWQDPLVNRVEGFAARFPITNSFPGISFGAGTPPDTVGDVGPNHYIQMVNASRFQIWDKDGNTLVGPVSLSSLWDGAPGSNCADGDGDPIVIYDGLADRWFLSEFDTAGNNLCFYISQGPNPVTDGWFVYDFSTPSFPDYPKYAAWPDGYYATTFEGGGMGLYAFDRTEMLQGNPATFQRFLISALSGSSPRVTRILPSDPDGPVAPPMGTPNFMIRTVDDTQDSTDPTDRIEIWEFTVDWVTPGNSSVVKVQDVPLTDFNLLPCAPSVRDCIVQPGTSRFLDALFNRALRQAQYRNWGTYESIVFNQVVDVGGGVAGKRWYELRRDLTRGAGATWSIFQEGTYSPDAAGRFMGSVALNGNGTMALGYSISSDTILPGIRFTGRFATTPPGQMLGETTILDGVGVQTNTQRWGDYSSMNVDPADDSTFWFTTEYIQANGQWTTHVASFIIEDDVFVDGFED